MSGETAVSKDIVTDKQEIVMTDDDIEILGQCYSLARKRAQEIWAEADRIYSQEIANLLFEKVE